MLNRRRGVRVPWCPRRGINHYYKETSPLSPNIRERGLVSICNFLIFRDNKKCESEHSFEAQPLAEEVNVGVGGVCLVNKPPFSNGSEAVTEILRCALSFRLASFRPSPPTSPAS